MAADSVFSESAVRDISLMGEIFRKTIHLAAISIPVGYYFLGRKITLICLAIALLASLTLDIIRIYGNEKAKKFVYRYLGIMIRAKEKKFFIGATWILSGSIITILFFDKPVAIAAIAFIVVGDTASAIVGRLWGRVRFRSKSLEGSIGFFAACCLVAFIIPGLPYWVKVAGALTATIVEALTLHIDDNFIVPITSAALMQVIVSQMVILEHFS